MELVADLSRARSGQYEFLVLFGTDQSARWIPCWAVTRTAERVGAVAYLDLQDFLVLSFASDTEGAVERLYTKLSRVQVSADAHVSSPA